MLETKLNRSAILLFIVFMLGIVLLFNHFFAFFGHYGFDDMGYARLAHSVTDGTFSLGNDHYNYRWVIIFLTSIAYQLFGINDHSSALFPIFFTLLTAWLVCKSMRSIWQAVLAVFFFGLHSWTIFYADKLMPDVYVAFFFLLAVFVIYSERFTFSSPLKNGTLFSFALLLGFLSKETIVLTFPVFCYLMVVDLFYKRNLRFWLVAAVVSSIMFVGYLSVIYLITGNFLQRFIAIQNGTYFNPCSYDLLPFIETFKRITYGLLFVFIRSGLSFLLLFASVAIFQESGKRLLKIETEQVFYSSVLLLTLLCSNFMSTSAVHYVPMCDDPRHYLFLVPIAAIVATKGVFVFIKSSRTFWWLPILFFTAFYIAWSNHFENSYSTYLVLGIATLGVVLASFAKKNMLAFFISLLLFAMIFQPLQAISYARSMGYNNQKRLISRTLLKEQRKVVVVTNIVEKNVGSYYLSFDTSYVVFKSFDEIDSLPLSTKYPVYLLLDGFSNTMAGKSWEDLPEYAKNTAGYITLDSEGGASLFQVNKKQ